MSNWGQNKPPIGSQINTNHPLSKGLVGCWLMNKDTKYSYPGYPDTPKNSEYNLANPSSYIILNTGQWESRLYLKYDKFGLGLYKNSNTYSYITFNKNVTNGIGSMVILFSTPVTNNNGICSSGDNNANKFTLNFSGGTTLTWTLNTSDSVRIAATCETNYQANKLNSLVITMGLSSNAIYLNGNKLSLSYTGGDSSTGNYWFSPTRFTDKKLGTDLISRDSGEYTFYSFLEYNRFLTANEAKDLYINPYQFIYKPRRVFYSILTGVTLSGTILNSTTETDIRTGGKTIILTLTGDTWVDSGATFDGQRQNIIDGIDSAQSEGTGWDAEVKAKAPVTDVERTSPTEVTVTLSAQSGYDITSTETITATVPASALTGGNALVANPTFSIIPVSAGTWGHKIYGINNANIGKVSQVDKANIGKVNGV